MIVAFAVALAVAHAPPAFPDPKGTRVYVARLRATEVSEGAAAAIEESILVAAKKARPDLTVLGRSDVATLADMQAEQSAAGCDAESCAAEIADALGAPQIVTGKLTRVGSTWILSLTRLERGSLLVLARESVEKQGQSAEVLVGEVPRLVERVFEATKAEEHGNHADAPHASSGAGVAGGVALGAGVVTVLVGGGLLGGSLLLFDDAQKQNAAGNTAQVKADGALGEPLYYGGWIALGTGVAIALVGAGVLVFSD